MNHGVVANTSILDSPDTNDPAIPLVNGFDKTSSLPNSKNPMGYLCYLI